MMRRRLHILLLTALLLPGCTSGRDPVADAKRAMAAGDLRLVGYMGVGLIVPGTPGGFQQELYKPGIRVLPGVTDTSPPADIAKADAYAKKYNQVILAGGGGAAGP